MDNEIINLYVQKQAQLITELTSKNLMVETRFEILEKRFKDLSEQHAALVNSIEQARAAAEQAEQSAAASKKELKRKQPSDPVMTKQDTESQF